MILVILSVALGEFVMKTQTPFCQWARRVEHLLLQCFPSCRSSGTSLLTSNSQDAELVSSQDAAIKVIRIVHYRLTTTRGFKLLKSIIFRT